MIPSIDSRMKALVASLDIIAAATVAFLLTGETRTCLTMMIVGYCVNLLNQQINFLPGTPEALSSLWAIVKTTAVSFRDTFFKK
jgi:uncharacterized membrane protein YjjP (DUF1212 family)